MGYTLKLKRKKVGDRKYDLIDTAVGDVVATAVNTSTGGDDYPWDWHLVDGLHFDTPEGSRVKEGGVMATLKDVVDGIEAAAKQYGFRS